MEAASPPPAPSPVNLPGNPTLPLAAVLLLVVGSIGPWVTLGSTSKGGLEGDGVITLVLALVVGVAILVARLRGRGASRVLVAICAVLALAVSIFDVLDVSGAEIDFSVGWGLWLTLAGSVVLVVAVLGRLMNR